MDPSKRIAACVCIVVSVCVWLLVFNADTVSSHSP